MSTTTTTTTSTPTKEEEIAALRAVGDQLGPHSYLGPWIRDALPWLADQLRCDYMPQRARAMAEEAARIKAAAISTADAIRAEARQLAAADLERGRKQAALLIADAQAEADRIKGSAWQAVRQAMRTLEA